MIRRLYVLALCIVFSTCAAEQEQILLFDADITVHSDATLTVKEEIAVQAQMLQIRHGIVREFPTKYTDRFGNNYVIDFTLKQVLLNGKPVDYKIEAKNNGNYIYIGNPNRYLEPGVYVYTLVYTVNRELGFFETHDELYWNVTGNGWRLPIKQVQARVRLPEGVDIAEIKVEGYTGRYGAQEKDLTADVTRNGVARFITTRLFHPGEGLTIVVGWPKGHVSLPNFAQKVAWFLSDNIMYEVFLGALLFLLGIFAGIYRNNKKRMGDAPIIPLFYPPKDMSPGLMHYIDQKKYSDQALAAEIVHMAVNGWLTIESSPGYLWGSSYRLVKKTMPSGKDNDIYKKLWDLFFKSKTYIELDRAQAVTLNKARTVVETAYAKKTPGYFELHEIWMYSLFLIGFFGFILATMMLEPSLIFFLLSGLVALVAWIGFRMLKSYSEKGFKIKREIDGFKLFLTVAEKDRMAMIGTPPTESPQLYETYLPYAMALGVERQWSEKFAPIFEKLKESGFVYRPVWFVGSRGQLFSPYSFSSRFTRSLSSSISSAAGVPGSSSGFGGRSGGGGGGFSVVAAEAVVAAVVAVGRNQSLEIFIAPHLLYRTMQTL